MFFAIDVGNTNTVLGIFKNNKVIFSLRIATSHIRTVDEYWLVTKLFCDNNSMDVSQLEGVIIGSVVPDVTSNFKKMVQNYLDVDIITVNSNINLGFELKVDIPTSVGADRICNIASVRENYKNPVIVIDLGTATTFDLMDENGDYVGGAIAPGIYTGSYELTRKAAQLSKIELKKPQTYIGKTTRDHLRIGIFTGHIAMIEGIVRRMIDEYQGNKQFNIIATGGLSMEIAENCDIIDLADVGLTLDGLRILYNRNKKI